MVLITTNTAMTTIIQSLIFRISMVHSLQLLRFAARADTALPDQVCIDRDGQFDLPNAENVHPTSSHLFAQNIDARNLNYLTAVAPMDPVSFLLLPAYAVTNTSHVRRSVCQGMQPRYTV